MIGTIIKDNVVNLDAIKDIKFYHGKYCILNLKTLETVKNSIPCDKILYGWHPDVDDTTMCIYGLYVAISNNLKYGEFEIR